MSTSRRVHERYALDLNVTLLHEGAEIAGRTKNVSLGGMLLSLEGDVPFGATLKVRVLFPPLKEETEVEAVVRWHSAGAVGVQFGSLRAKEVWALNQMFKDAKAV